MLTHKTDINIKLKSSLQKIRCGVAQFAIMLIAVALFISGCNTTQNANRNSSTGSYATPGITSTGSTISRSTVKDDVIRIGDSMVVSLTGVPTQDQGVFEVRVDEAGNISMPYINTVRAAGLTSVTLKEKIETLYRTSQIYTTPNITILTREERFVSVTGEVRSPQRLQHTKDLTALGAIAGCGGFTDYANQREVKLLRGGEVILFNAKDVMNNPSLDIRLEPDDKIQVDRSIF